MTVARIARADGRSNQQVIIDLVKNREPGTMFGFDQLIETLSEGTPRVFGRGDVTAVVNAANRRLLQSFQRCLHNIRGEGYRLATASDHLPLARTDRRRGNRQLQKGMLKLRNVRWEELDPVAREAHEGTLMVMSAVLLQQESFERRLSAIEEVIARSQNGGGGGG